ncbi:MAG TPA: S41 family peptidase [Candidatus Faecimonas gallistercoris]|nr:S41 family peptidase [Candidatus Faecimonas gallistercoris]
MAKHKKFSFTKPNLKKIIHLKSDKSQENDVADTSINSFNTIEVLIIIIVSITFGIVVGVSLSFFRDEYRGEKVSNSLQELITVYQNILNSYYKNIDEKDLADAAIDGMMSSLDDPYSTYMDEENTETFNETVDGSYVGIGITITVDKNGDFSILDVANDSPAEKAKIKKGDVIIDIDGKELDGVSLDEVTTMVKGKEGSKLSLTILRDGKKIKKTVSRGSIDLVSVNSQVYALNNGNAGYISISSFAANTYKQFKKELKKVEDKNIMSLIIDVRSNPGGHLSQTKKILELFIKKNKVLYQVEFKGNKTKIKDQTKTFRSYPVVILVNSSSASASEILAAAFKDSYTNVTILGETTYGKGTVQTAYSLSDGSSLKYTTERWLTPKGKWIDGKGVTPDKEVLLTDEYLENPIAENDLQLQSALDILKKDAS